MICFGASLVPQTVKNLPAMEVTQVWSLGWEDSLEKGTAAHSSVLFSEIPRQRSLADYSPWGGRAERDWETHPWFVVMAEFLTSR